MTNPTPQDWAKWYAHKSNKERWIEAQEQEEALKDEMTDLEIKSIKEHDR